MIDLTIGNVNGGTVRASFLESLLQTFVQPPEGCRVSFSQATGLYVDRLRDELAGRFLDRGEGEWLLFVDSDMVWQPEDVDKLLDSGRSGRLVVGGVYFNTTSEGVATVAWPGEPDEKRLDWRGGGLKPVKAIGTGFLLIHADVLGDVREHFGAMFENQRNPDAPGGWVGEDVNFCWRAGQLGHQVWADCDVVLGHEKTIQLGLETVA